MNVLFSVARPSIRTAALRRAPFTLRSPYTRLAPLMPTPRPPTSRILRLATALQQTRSVASSVSGRPGSQTIQQAALNVREEVGNSTTDWAKTIAGGNLPVDSMKSTGETFVGHSLFRTRRPLRVNAQTLRTMRPTVRNHERGCTRCTDAVHRDGFGWRFAIHRSVRSDDVSLTPSRSRDCRYYAPSFPICPRLTIGVRQGSSRDLIPVSH